MRLESEHIAKLCPPSGRRDTLVKALRLLHDTTEGEDRIIIEVGTSRDARPIACLNDGWATRVFAWYASVTGGRVITLDSRSVCLEASRRIVGNVLAPWVTFRETDASKYLLGHMGRIDLLYLDGPTDSQFTHECVCSLQTTPRLVLLDDVAGKDYSPKGTLAVPCLLDKGYELVFYEQQQALLERQK